MCYFFVLCVIINNLTFHQPGAVLTYKMKCESVTVSVLAGRGGLVQGFSPSWLDVLHCHGSERTVKEVRRTYYGLSLLCVCVCTGKRVRPR